MSSLAPKYAMYALNKPTDQLYHTIDLFLDLTCPFSAKMWKTLVENNVLSSYKNVQFIFRHQIQPWHAQSTLLHTALIAVAKHHSEKFQKAASVLFNYQQEFFDAQVKELTFLQIYEKAIQLLKKECEISLDIDQFKVGQGNSGNSFVDDLKYHIKYARKHAVHVSPTVFVNGLEEPSISSSWTNEQWKEFLTKL
ncbi:unnamed protein product [Didymodactylos carnosus]|uniref:Thioredoxin-like fold domain-containing protein n=1 Tax=Didymodactylos carnosus TaxID=1234261 RepID=A0A814BRM8_9BILA|nr:unnamed protein product [Didymodactylos carnosus]CAF0929849.1 unnamed protein product [Didymodactylos carnosus]CAF3634827.1 unnamed protein product [Didymodactylos carnosus]CAF3707961.1 unnamed protein product [Didymodactylos carnosus]